LSSFQSVSFAQNRAASPKPELLIAAASDLSPLQEAFREGFPAATLTFSFGSSGSLSRQIGQGAPFDVFLSANEAFVMNAVAAGKINKEDVQVFATGRLGMWSKSGAFQSFGDFSKFAKLRIAIANPELAPYGLAAKQALEKFRLWDRYQPDIVYAENVRQAFQFAETGNVDVAIVAWSLVHDKNGVLVPAEAHAPIRQMGAELRRSKQRKLGRQFMEFLTSPKGKAILTSHGLFVANYAPSLKR
jgi:molybdate transport system substrate-binding protein